MKIYIIYPPVCSRRYFLNAYTSEIFDLFRQLCENNIFTYSNTEGNPPNDCDVCLCWGRVPPIFKKCFKHTITLWDDIHFFDEQTKKNRHSLFNNASYILTPSSHTFGIIANNEFKGYVDKIRFIPWTVSEKDIANNTQNKINKFILSGAGIPKNAHNLKKTSEISSSTNIYRLRELLYSISKERDDIDVLTKNKGLVGSEYVKYLSSYRFAFGVLAGTESECNYSNNNGYGYLVKKVVEILASGSVLIADPKPAFKDIGLEPYIHYIPCSLSDLLSSHFLDDIKNIPFEQTEQISKNAIELVQNRLTHRHAAEIIYSLIINEIKPITK